jgi:hypothetical protein
MFNGEIINVLTWQKAALHTALRSSEGERIMLDDGVDVVANLHLYSSQELCFIFSMP